MTTSVFLVNPASANGSTGRRWPEIQRRASAAGLVGDAFLSTRPGEIAELAERAARDGVELAVVVGGDGTLNEAVNGLMRGDHRPALAMIPIGTGMDFIRTHGIPKPLDEAFRVARTGRTIEVDVGHVQFSAGERYFANVGSVGMSGAVAKRANAMSKAFGGRVTFFYALTREFLVWKNTQVVVEIDGETRRGAMHDVVIANGSYHGGAMRLAPAARPDDGLFDVVTIGDISKLDFITTAPKLYSGKYLGHPKVELLRGARVDVDAAEPIPIELDGEPAGTTPARFEVVPRALRLKVP